MLNAINLDDGLQLSQLVYGVWRLGDDDDTSITQVRAKIDLCLEQGITSFDHADIYGDYQCEALFGKALAQSPELRGQMQLISKCNIALTSARFPNRRVKHYDTSAQYITDSVEQALVNLHTDHLDILMMHRPDPLMDAAQTGAALDALVDSGKVKAIGVSNFSRADWQLLQKHMSHKLQVNQIEISLLASECFRDGTLADLQTDQIQVMAWSPLAGGALFSTHPVARRLQPLFKSLCERFQCSADQIAIAWLLAHPANIIPVVGTNNLERIKTLSKASEIKLDRETWFELYSAAQGCEVP